MKTSTLFCSIFSIIACTQLISANISSESESLDILENEVYLEENLPTDGMFFNSASVVESYEYDDAYCIVYDDADANMFNVEICVDLATYKKVVESVDAKQPFVGSLVLNEKLSRDGLDIFTFMPDPEFEMAAASASL